MALNPPESVETATKHPDCDGGGGALGHPKVYLEMGEETHVSCPYCGRLFYLEGTAVPDVVTG